MSGTPLAMPRREKMGWDGVLRPWRLFQHPSLKHTHTCGGEGGGCGDTNANNAKSVFMAQLELEHTTASYKQRNHMRNSGALFASCTNEAFGL